MTDIEDRLEVMFGYAFPEREAGLAAVDALQALGLLAARSRRALARALERCGRTPQPMDGALRTRCLALLEGLPPDASGEDSRGMLPHHFSEAGLVTYADLGYEGDDVPVPPVPVPRGVALGPPPVDGGVHVVWIATFDDRVELALRDAPLDRFDTGTVSLRDPASGAVHGQHGCAFDNHRGHMRFAPCPTGSTVELAIGEDVIALPVP